MKRGPTPFVILADLRTGSTLLSTALDQHPEIRCHGEVLHPDALPDNQPPGLDRRAASGREIVDHCFEEGEVLAAGFRAMIFLPLPSHPRWESAWDRLAEAAGLRVIDLRRRDALAQFASVIIAGRAQAYHPGAGHPILDPRNRPRIEIDPLELGRWCAERGELRDRRRRSLGRATFLEIDYESLVGGWRRVMARVQHFLGVTVLDLPQTQAKQETRPLFEVVTNYADLRDTAGRSAAARRGRHDG